LDDRSIDWLFLLPPTSRFVADGAPSTIRALLEGRIASDGDSYLGWHAGPEALGRLSAVQSAVLVNPHGISPLDLDRLGFSETREFTALPSFNETRWLMPTAPSRVASRALDVYAAHHRTAKVKKRVVQMLARLGLAHLLGDRLVLARRAKSLLEEEAERIANDSPVYLSVSTGTPQAHRKPTIQVMTGRGQIVAYAKIAASAAARAALNKEIDGLRELGRQPGLVGAIPRLVGTFETADVQGAFQSPGPPGSAPTTFGRPHQELLSALAEATRRRLPFRQSVMWRSIDGEMAEIGTRLTPTWQVVLGVSLRRLLDGFGQHEIELGTAHRDFRPRNHRLHRDGRLFVFDWELARPETTPLYDLFDFHAEGYAYYERRTNGDELIRRVFCASRRWAPNQDPGFVRYCFLAYLIDRALTRIRNGMGDTLRREDRLLPLLGAALERQERWLPDLAPAHLVPN
jgi:hypothetical protein